MTTTPVSPPAPAPKARIVLDYMWRRAYIGRDERVKVYQMTDENGKPEFPCTFTVVDHHLVDVVDAEALVKEIQTAIAQARAWNREWMNNAPTP